MNTTKSRFALVAVARISTAFPIAIDDAIIEALANSIEAVGFNVIPLIVRDYGDAFKPDYNLIDSTYQQVSVLMACKLLKARNPKFEMCTVVIVNPIGETGERVERAQAIAAQIGLSRP